jgi:hypothetical protein
MRKVRGSMTPVTGGASHIAIKGQRSGLTVAPMRKLRPRGRRFVVGRRRGGKSLRTAAPAGAAKRVRETALGPPATVQAVAETAAGWVTGQYSALAAAPTLVASGAPVEADRQTRFRDLEGAVRCVMRAHAAPRAGAEEGKRQAAGAFSVPVEVPMVVVAAASSVAGAAVEGSRAAVGAMGAVGAVVVADAGEAGGGGYIRP